MNDLKFDFLVGCQFLRVFFTTISPVKWYCCVESQRAYSFG